MSAAPKTLSIVNNNGNFNITSEAYIHSKCSGFNINVLNAFNNGISQIESDNDNILRSINGNVSLEAYSGVLNFTSLKPNSAASILFNASAPGGGISLLSNTGGITANSTGDVNLLSYHANVNVGAYTSGNPSDYTANVNIESLYRINNTCEDFSVIAADTISLVSNTGDISFGTGAGTILQFYNGNVLINQSNSSLNRQLDVKVTKSSNASTGYDGLIINTANTSVAADTTMQTSDSNAIISIGIQPASSIHATYKEYIAYQTGTTIIPVSGEEFTSAGIGYSIYWNSLGYTDSIVNLGTIILPASNTYATYNITTSGTYTGTASTLFKVEIDSVGATDTFRWSPNAGVTYVETYKPIVSGAIALQDGVSITFQATTGNALEDYWTFWTKITAISNTSRSIPATHKMWTLQPYTGYVKTNTISDIQISTSSNEIGRFTANGQLALGQNNPHAMLEVTSTAGTPSLANDYNLNYQINPAIASFDNGTYVITWEDATQDGSGYGIYAQLYQNNGAKIGNQFGVNITTLANQSIPQIAARNILNSTDYIIVWQSETGSGSGEYDIYAQIFSNGVPIKTSDINVYSYTNPSHNSLNPRVAGLSDGNYLVVWSSYVQVGFSYYYYVYGNVVYSNGNVGTKFQINQTATTNNILPYIGVLSPNDPTLPNGFVVCFMRQYNATPKQYQVYYQLFNSSKVAQSASDRQIITTEPYPTLTDGQISCCGLANGGFTTAFYRNFDANTSNYSTGMSVVGQTSGTTGVIVVGGVIGLNITVTLTSRYILGELITIDTHYTEKIYDVTYTYDISGNITGAVITLSTGYRGIAAFTYATNSLTPVAINTQVNTSPMEEDKERSNAPVGLLTHATSVFTFKRPLAQVLETQSGEVAVVWTNGETPHIYYQRLNSGTLTASPSNKETKINNNPEYNSLKQRDPSTTALYYNNGNLAGLAIAWDIEAVDASVSGIYQIIENFNPIMWVYNNNGAILALGQSGNVGIGISTPADLLHIVASSSATTASNITIQNASSYINTDINGFGAANLNFQNAAGERLGVLAANYSNYYQALNPRYDSLVAYYSMDGVLGESTITDLSANGLIGNLNQFDPEECWVPGVVNNGLLFTTTNNYVDLGITQPLNQLALTTSFSVSLWVKLSSNDPAIGKTMTLLTNGGDTTAIGTYLIQLTNTSVVFKLVDDLNAINTVTTAITVNDDESHHLAFTYSNTANQIKIWVDSVLAATSSVTSTINAAPGKRCFMGSTDGTTDIFRGMLDEVRIYNTTLTADDIATLYKYGSQRLGALEIFTGATHQGIIIDDTARIQGVNMRGEPFTQLTGTLTTYNSSTLVSGSNTKFTTELRVGDTLIFSPSSEVVVTRINSDVAIIVSRPTTNNNHNHVIRKPAIAGFYNSDGYFRGVMNQSGNLLICSPLTDQPSSSLTGNYTTSSKLEVCGDDGNVNSKPFIRLTNSNSSYTENSTETRIEFRKAFNSYSSNIQTLAYLSTSHSGTSDDTKGQFRIFVNNGSVATETLVIKPTGYMGLGYQVDPRGIFHIIDADNANVVVMSSSNDQLVYGERNRIYFAGKTSSTNAGSDPALFGLSAIQGCSGSANDNVAGRLDLLTNNADGDGVIQRLSVLASGNVGVGITEPQSVFQAAPRATAVTGITGMQAGYNITLSYSFTDDNIIGGFIIFDDQGQTTRRIVSRVAANQFLTDVFGSIGSMTAIKLYYPGLNVNNNGNVAVGTTSTTSRFHIEGAMSTAIKTLSTSGTYTVTPRDSTLLVDTTTGVITVSLPTCADCTGRIYVIKKVDSSGNNVTITSVGGELIDGLSTYPLTTQYQVIRVQSNGVNWWII